MKKVIGSETIYINPSIAELGTYQKHGLGTHDRKPNDYLRMVAKTFSAFRETDGEDTIAAYISGFEIEYEKNSIETYVDDSSIESLLDYHIFTINKGTCIVDNQLINFSNTTMLYYPWNHFNSDLTENRITYCIVIEYDYLDQYTREVAQIHIVNKEFLTFPDENQNEKCFHIQGKDNGETIYNGKPGLVIGTFAVDLRAEHLGEVCQVVQIDGENIIGINSQELGKLYMNNYKSLFKHFGTEAMRVYSDMLLTNSNFLSVSNSDISPDLTSGSMCYFDPVKCVYMKSKASHLRIDRVAGLFLREKDTGNNIIFFNGLVQFPPNKWQLDLDSTLRNLVPGQGYYLEDRTRTLLKDDPILNIEGVRVADSSGRITPKEFAGAVSIGTAMASNMLLLNINKEQEITVTNIMDIVGKHEEFELEYVQAQEATKFQLDINKKTEIKNSKIKENNTIDVVMGENIAVSSGELGIQAENSIESVEWHPEYKLIINAYSRMFLGLDFKTADGTNVYSLDLFEKSYNSSIFDGDTGEFNIHKFKNLFNSSVLFTSDGTSNGFTYYNNTPSNINFEDFGNILTAVNDSYKSVNGIISVLDAIINSIVIILYSNIPESYDDTAVASKAMLLKTNFKDYIINKINLARLKEGDSLGVTNNFENELLNDANSSTVEDLSVLEGNLENQVEASKISKDQKLGAINDSIKKINTLKNYLDLAKAIQAYLKGYKILFETDKIANNTIITELTTELEELEIQKGIAIQNAPEGIPYALDIFLMDDYQRKVFNYTYLTERLRKRLWQRSSLEKDLEKAILNGKIIENESDGSDESIIAKLVQEKEIERIKLVRDNNDHVIVTQTEEYNKIRTEWGLLSIALYDVNFDDAGRTSQKIEDFRYGNDDHKYCYNGVCSNLISPCSGLLMHFRLDDYSQGDYVNASQNETIINRPSLTDKKREMFVLRHTDMFFGPTKLKLRFYDNDGTYDKVEGTGNLSTGNLPGTFLVEDIFKVEEYIEPNEDGVSGVQEYNSDELPANYYFEKYSTDSQVAIANLTHDPALKVILEVSDTVPAGDHSYIVGMYVERQVKDENGITGTLEEYLGNIDYKITIQG